MWLFKKKKPEFTKIYLGPRYKTYISISYLDKRLDSLIRHEISTYVVMDDFLVLIFPNGNQRYIRSNIIETIDVIREEIPDEETGPDSQ